MSVTYEEILNLFRENDLQIKELLRSQQETDRKFQDTDRKFQETDRRLQDTDRLVKQLSKNLGDIGNRLGEFVEHMVAPAVVRLFRQQGLDVHVVYPGVAAKRDGVALEIDLLVVNDGALVAVECKSKLIEDHIDAHLLRLATLKQVLPIYQDYRVMGAVAGMVVGDEVAQYAAARGLYVLSQTGEQVDVRNPEGFDPAVW
ncbi:DUF3782 domain-containing protein [Lamprobacter sp.]|uniref:DUF3782 domain-containing protein n=1 Tax=Lamprobacter sp. TaxID=3100796 RepID=UPI002B25671B|nr:DUF3782 domain-containing protein [Lamprobacter sp.]